MTKEEMWKEEVQKAIADHRKYLGCEEGGRKANFSECDLRGFDLRGACLESANLFAADLRGADLRGADLNHANLCCADLRGAKLQETILDFADLTGARIKE